MCSCALCMYVYVYGCASIAWIMLAMRVCVASGLTCMRKARTQVTPRFPIGTHVSKYFPGYADPFGGIVDDYSTYSGFYHITYEDGDSEEMTETDLEVHVIIPHPTDERTRPTVESPKPKKTLVLNLNDKAPGVKVASNSKNATTTSPRVGSGKSSPQASSTSTATSPRNRQSTPSAPAVVRPLPPTEDGPFGEVNNLIGRGISKAFVGDDGREKVVNGTVSAYFIATRKYRVLFFNGHCEDLSYQDVVESLPLSSPSDEESSRKRKMTDGGGRGGGAAPSASPKKHKAMESSSTGSVGGGGGRSSNSNGSGSGSESSKKSKRESEGASSSILDDISPPFDTSQGLTKVFAHSVTRNVLFFVMSSSPGATDDKKRQVDILSDVQLGVSTTHTVPPLIYMTCVVYLLTSSMALVFASTGEEGTHEVCRE